MLHNSGINETRELIDYLRLVPYDVMHKGLYCSDELYQGYDCECPDTFRTCFDTLVYNHYLANGKQASTFVESMARTLHDHAITVAIKGFLSQYEPKRCVGVMGGHALPRTDSMFRQIVIIAKRLTEQNFCMISGGGPGAMEATHLGAWMAGRSDDELEQAMQMLLEAPSFRDQQWLASAIRVTQRFPQRRYRSLSIPTWLYGHEPSTPFATDIAKLFDNSIREDGILTYAYGGIIYTPGSAGTIQEVFQEAVQNHYLSFGFSSPMVFLGKRFWTEELPVYSLLTELHDRGIYKNLILDITDDTDQVIAHFENFVTTT